MAKAKILKKTTAFMLTAKQNVLIDKLCQIQETNRSELIAKLVLKEAKVYGLIESREGD